MAHLESNTICKTIPLLELLISTQFNYTVFYFLIVHWHKSENICIFQTVSAYIFGRYIHL